jgi:hypothetical protein
MSWVSYYGDITERQVQNGARVIFENYTHLARHNNKLSPKGKEFAETAEFLEMSRENSSRRSSGCRRYPKQAANAWRRKRRLSTH